MILKVFDVLRSLGWYIIDFVYNLIDSLLKIIRELNCFDIINSISNNDIFVAFYRGVVTIAVTLFALYVTWKFIQKVIDPDDEITIKFIVTESVKCGFMIILSTFLFSQVSDFSIKLSGFTSDIFTSNSELKMSDSMLKMYINYNDDYLNSGKFEEPKTIEELISSGEFSNDEKFNDKYVVNDNLILSDDKDYKYEINWIMAVICGGFFLYSLFFAGMMLGRRQIEFLFLFVISPIVFSTSVCNKQRRGAVIEQLTSLVLQSAVVMLIVNITVLIMQQVNGTTFFPDSAFQDVLIKSLLYVGCGTFILTGSQVINRFIGANVSAASGREQLMSLMGFGHTVGAAATVGTNLASGAGMVALGGAMKGGNYAKNSALTTVGSGLAYLGATSDGSTPTGLKRFMSDLGTRMYASGTSGFKALGNAEKISASSAIMNAGIDNLQNAVRSVMPRAGYNASIYRRQQNFNRSKI
ncbi:MAG TPA: hypothetical protein PLT65_00720 [Bacilli bacterium]|nr:hypothetical protein [Bacilli bacterium]